MNTPPLSDATTTSDNSIDSAVLEPRAQQESDRPGVADPIEHSEASYRYLFEANPQPMWILDCETLRFLLVNDAAIEHYGYSQDEFLAMTLMDIRPAADMPLLSEALLNEMKSGGPSKGKRGIWRHKKKNGQIIDVEVTGNSLHFRGRAARLGLVHDLTERRQAEQALQHIMGGAHCLLWQAEAEEIGDGQLRCDIQLTSEQAAQRFLPLYLSEGQEYQDAWRLSRPQEDRERTDRYSAQEIRAGKSYQQEFRCRSKDGVLHWLSENVRVEALGEGKWRCIGVCTDITERKLAEEATRAMTRGAQCLLWYALVEEQPHGLRWLMEMPEEEAAQQFFPVKQSLGQSYVVAWTRSRMPEDGAIMDTRSAAALRSGQQGYTQQFRCLRADGEWRWLHETVRIEALTPGRWRCVGVCTDVTEQKRTEEELEARVVDRTAQIMEVNTQLVIAKQEADRANHAKSEFLSRM
ncbi:MAG: two-component system sensor protein, partial [Chthonomonadaceae bacterium]|nr:two-component system sensor protein [Chthonomonadaceae bacterium]